MNKYKTEKILFLFHNYVEIIKNVIMFVGKCFEIFMSVQ